VSTNIVPLADDKDNPVGSTFTFEGKHLFMGYCKHWYTVEIDPSATPKQMDLVRMGDDAGRKEAEPCIYEVNGTQLKICCGGGGRFGPPRPTDFANTNLNVTYVLKRPKR
jgi:uncharacterized protein (TIGR03067 family)